MKKLSMKLVLALLSLVVAAVMIISVTFAWMVLSKNPAVNGISVTLGGGRTILLAPDCRTTVTDGDGNEITAHYPGEFSSTLRLSGEEYAYLADIGALMPVSTADGRYFMIAKSGVGSSDSLEKRFDVDSTLSYANPVDGGGYVYFDLWIVSPGSEYDVRVSTDANERRGSYLIELPSVIEDSERNLTLDEPQNVAAATARVGFLVNSDVALSSDMLAYTESASYNGQYRSLLGVYDEPGTEQDPVRLTNFTVYEPNGMLHPSGDAGYAVTQPLGYDPFRMTVSRVDISSILTVQTENVWKEDPGISQIFRAAVAGRSGLTPESAREYFYGSYLQNNIDEYLETGLFVRNTAELYGAAADGWTSADDAAAVPTAGASDGAVITTLRRNVPQRIRVFVWLEGEDADSSLGGAVSASEIAVKIELAGDAG